MTNEVSLYFDWACIKFKICKNQICLFVCSAITWLKLILNILGLKLPRMLESTTLGCAKLSFSLFLGIIFFIALCMICIKYFLVTSTHYYSSDIVWNIIFKRIFALTWKTWKRQHWIRLDLWLLFTSRFLIFQHANVFVNFNVNFELFCLCENVAVLLWNFVKKVGFKIYNRYLPSIS